ncbi:MAG TPA: hypothetical protein V6C76_02350 [Drouetiella sp.]
MGLQPFDLKTFNDKQESSSLKSITDSDAWQEARKGITDAEHSKFFKDHDKSLKDLVGGILPPVDLIGFDKEAPDHSTGVTKVWHELEHLFGKHRETFGDQVREKVVDDMKNSKNPAEQAKYKKYENEEKALHDYDEKCKAWGLQMTINPGPYPERPQTPEHDEVADRARKQEQKIIDGVRSHMTPAERKQVDSEQRDVDERVRDAKKIHRIDGTGDGFEPEPQPSEAMTRYIRHIQEATDLYTGR